MAELLMAWSHRGPTGTVLTLTGRLDNAAAGLLAREIGDLLRQGSRTAIIVDVGGLDFISAAGVGVLSLLHAAATQLGVSLRVRRPSGEVRTRIESSGSGLLLGGVRPAGTVQFPAARSDTWRDGHQLVRSSPRQHFMRCRMTGAARHDRAGRCRRQTKPEADGAPGL